MSQSPAVYAQSPNSQITPSPAANYTSRTPGAPSPGSALNTPRNYFKYFLLLLCTELIYKVSCKVQYLNHTQYLAYNLKKENLFL